MTVFKGLVPDALEVEAHTYDHPTFIDGGGNFGQILCPSCGADLSVGWWQDQMDAAGETKFLDLDVLTPCCDNATTLNDLAYEWPLAFAVWELRAMSPDRGELDEDEVAEISSALGHEVRQIWRHI